ncbi:MAG: polysaccharide deacetylase family protein [Betaproteobacteria bacterium]
MIPLPLRQRRAPTSVLRALAAIGVALVLHGCATPPAPIPDAVPVVVADRGPVLARDAEYIVVVAAAGDTAATFAQRYLGDARKAWWITEFNAIADVRPGQTVVVPLSPRNRIGVYADGYQTVPVLCYHRFGSRASKLTVTPAAFAAQMDYLAQNGFHVLTFRELGDFLDGKAPLPRKSVMITIDDGYRSTYEVAWPVLRKHGFPATVFLYSDFVGAGDALTWPQMKEMTTSGVIEIQPHSKSHANLTLRLPDETDAKYRDRTRREVDAPIGIIQERLGVASATYAYPYGDVNETVVDLLTRQGVRLGVTVTPGGNGFFAYPYMLRRSMVFGDEGIDAFKTKLVTFVRTAGR